MSIASVATRGFGNGTFTGTIPLVATRGYSIGEAIEINAPWFMGSILQQETTGYALPAEDTGYNLPSETGGKKL